MQFNFLIVRLFYNLTGRKGKESFKKLSITSVLHGKFFLICFCSSRMLIGYSNVFFSLDQMTLKLLRFEQFNFMLNLFRFHLEMVILCGIFITKNDH